VEVAMERLVQRINGLAQVHDILSRSEWAPVPLSDLAARIVSSTLNALPLDRQVRVEVTPSPIQVSPRQASNLTLVINELATNTVKHVAPERGVAHITVHIACEDGDAVLLEYRDDGPGYPEDVLCLERHGVGLYLVQNLVRHVLHGSLALANDSGAVTSLRFTAEKESAT
jgi:two-component sensor histidine kinase